MFKKYIIYILISLLVGSLSTLFFANRSFTTRANQYQITIDKLGRELEEQRNRITEITRINSELELQIRNILTHNRRAEETIESIRNGLSGDVEDLSDIIRRLSKVIEILQQYENNEQDIYNNWHNDNSY